MKRVTKLKILKVVETLVFSFWYSIGLNTIILMFLHSLDITIKHHILYFLACWFMMMFIETFCYRIKEIFFDDVIGDEINKEKRA